MQWYHVGSSMVSIFMICNKSDRKDKFFNVLQISIKNKIKFGRIYWGKKCLIIFLFFVQFKLYVVERNSDNMFEIEPSLYAVSM